MSNVIPFPVQTKKKDTGVRYEHNVTQLIPQTMQYPQEVDASSWYKWYTGIMEDDEWTR